MPVVLGNQHTLFCDWTISPSPSVRVSALFLVKNLYFCDHSTAKNALCVCCEYLFVIFVFSASLRTSAKFPAFALCCATLPVSFSTLSTHYPSRSTIILSYVEVNFCRTFTRNTYVSRNRADWLALLISDKNVVFAFIIIVFSSILSIVFAFKTIFSSVVWCYLFLFSGSNLLWGLLINLIFFFVLPTVSCTNPFVQSRSPWVPSLAK